VGKLLVLAFFLPPLALAHGQDAPRVRQERGRFWIQCQSAPLEETLREIAALSPMELWLDEGLSGKRVSASVEGATLKQAIEDLFEKVKDVNYVLTFDPSNPERVTKIYAGGGGGGRLGREPTVTASEPEPEPEEPQDDLDTLLQELDPEALLGSPEAQEALGALREHFEQQAAEGGSDGTLEKLSPDLEELLKSLPELEGVLPEATAKPAPPTKKQEPQP
jgi:hypothetical protein